MGVFAVWCSVVRAGTSLRAIHAFAARTGRRCGDLVLRWPRRAAWLPAYDWLLRRLYPSDNGNKYGMVAFRRGVALRRSRGAALLLSESHALAAGICSPFFCRSLIDLSPQVPG